MASNDENVSIWWRHHDQTFLLDYTITENLAWICKSYCQIIFSTVGNLGYQDCFLDIYFNINIQYIFNFSMEYTPVTCIMFVIFSTSGKAMREINKALHFFVEWYNSIDFFNKQKYLLRSFYKTGYSLSSRRTFMCAIYMQGFSDGDQWPLLLTWFNFNPSMDK